MKIYDNLSSRSQVVPHRREDKKKKNSHFLQFRECAWIRVQWNPNLQPSNYKSSNLTHVLQRSAGCNGQKYKKTSCWFCLISECRLVLFVILLCQKVFMLIEFETNLIRLGHTLPLLKESICKRLWQSLKTVFLHNGQ